VTLPFARGDTIMGSLQDKMRVAEAALRLATEIRGNR
jgi:hypothetical protein